MLHFHVVFGLLTGDHHEFGQIGRDGGIIGQNTGMASCGTCGAIENKHNKTIGQICPWLLDVCHSYCVPIVHQLCTNMHQLCTNSLLTDRHRFAVHGAIPLNPQIIAASSWFARYCATRT
jgi:hypothetical protein